MEKATAILKSFFERKKSGHPSYSMRALARDLGLSPSFLSEVLAGKKRLALGHIHSVAKVLDLDSEAVMALKQAYLPEELRHAVIPGRKTKSGERSDFAPIGKKQFNVLRQWYYLAILDLTLCSDFAGDAADIAKRLKLHPETAAVAVRELLNSGLLIEEDGRLKKAQSLIDFSSSVPTAEIRNFHAQMLEKAKRELLEKPAEGDIAKRLISGITCSADKNKIALAKKMLSDCLYEIAEMLCEGDGCTEVYHLAVQLFPLTEES